MNFVVDDVKAFSDTLKIIQSVVQPGTGSVFALVVKKDSLWIYANNELHTMKCKPKGISSVEGKGIAGIDIDRFDKVLKGRDKINFINKDTVFEFKAVKGTYKGDIAIIPVVEDTITTYEENLAKSKKAELSSLDNAAFITLRNTLALTNLSLIHTSDVLDTFIKVSKGILEVTASDNFHLAYCKTKIKSDAVFQLSPAKSVFDILGRLSEFYGQTTDIEFAENAIKASTKSYAVCMPTLQSSDTAFMRCKSYIADLGKPTSEFGLKLSEVNSVMDNVFSIYEEGTLVSMEVKGKKADSLSITLRSTMGSISDSIPLEKAGKPFKCNFDPRLLMDSINLSKCKEANFSYYDGKSIVLTCEKDKTSITYVNSVVVE